MNPKLRTMLVSVGVVALGGVGFWLYTPQPSARSMLELRDAGIGEGQPLVLICPERITAQTRRRINKVQPGFLRPRQQYARVARVAKCFNPDGGNCFKPAAWVAAVADLEGEVIIPSLRRNLIGVDQDAGLGDDADGGETEDVDDSFQYRLDDCRAEKCTTYDAGTLNLPFTNALCGTLNRLWAEVPPCVIPDCTGPDGGWDDSAGEPGHMPAPNCKRIEDGSPRWAGCNVYKQWTGTQCIPVECSVVAGDGVDVLMSK